VAPVEALRYARLRDRERPVTADFTDTSTETREIGGQTMFWLLEAPEERRVEGLSAGVRP